MKRVLVTAAAGRIGSAFAQASHQQYKLRLMVLPNDPQAETIRLYGEVVEAELGDLSRLKEVCAGMDTVVHLAGNPNPNTAWADLLNNNIIGTYNLMVAAKSVGCRRVVFASSIHVMSGYPIDVQAKIDDPIKPGDLYGVSKAFGEALGSYLADQEGLSVIAVRIGWYLEDDSPERIASLRYTTQFISQRDTVQLLQKCVDVEDVQYAIVHGLSENLFKRLDISDTRELLGYAPQDDFTQIHPDLNPLDLDVIKPLNQAGYDYESGIRDDV